MLKEYLNDSDFSTFTKLALDTKEHFHITEIDKFIQSNSNATLNDIFINLKQLTKLSGCSDYDKNQTLERMAREYCFNPRKAIFVGDGKADYECAKHFGIPFIAIVNETNDFATNPDVKYRLKDLTGLAETIKKIGVLQ